jgi:hypothetical protein
MMMAGPSAKMFGPEKSGRKNDTNIGIFINNASGHSARISRTGYDYSWLALQYLWSPRF